VSGFEINEKNLSMAVCNGCLYLFRLCQGLQFLTIERFCNLPLK